MSQPCALVMAGGTGGHIFPGLAVADALRERNWRVHWLGAPGSMEQQLVPLRGYPFEAIDFGGVRGKGLTTLVLLPLRLLRAFAQSIAVIRRVKPDVLVGLGGYITFPGGLMGVALGKPLVLHEQNSVAGLANKVLAGIADRVFTAFPGVLAKARRVQCVGNPLRAEFAQVPGPEQRFAGRSGPLRLLVVGGSLGARALNELVPQALRIKREHLAIGVFKDGLHGAKQSRFVDGCAKEIRTLHDFEVLRGIQSELNGLPCLDGKLFDAGSLAEHFGQSFD